MASDHYLHLVENSIFSGCSCDNSPSADFGCRTVRTDSSIVSVSWKIAKPAGIQKNKNK
jgi:hypothetical protein